MLPAALLSDVAAASLYASALASDCAAAVLLASASLAAALAVSSSALMRSRADAISSSVGMPVTPSRMTPQREGSSRVSAMVPAVISVEPAGRVIWARHRSYSSAVREMPGAVG